MDQKPVRDTHVDPGTARPRSVPSCSRADEQASCTRNGHQLLDAGFCARPRLLSSHRLGLSQLGERCLPWHRAGLRSLLHREGAPQAQRAPLFAASSQLDKAGTPPDGQRGAGCVLTAQAVACGHRSPAAGPELVASPQGPGGQSRHRTSPAPSRNPSILCVRLARVLQKCSPPGLRGQPPPEARWAYWLLAL